jgi:O-antigen/teichoic acid export membrane protein
MSIATALRVVAQVAQLFILGRLLTPDDFGLMTMVMVVILMGQAVADAGISNAIIHYQDATREELSSLYWLNVLAGALVCAVVWASIPALVGLWDEPRLTGLIRWSTLALFITPFGLQFQVLLEKALRFRRVAAVEAVGAVASLVVGIATALGGEGVYSLVWALIAYAALRTLLLVVSGVQSWRPQARFVWRDCTRFLRFGVYQMGDRVLNQFSAQMDKLMIGALIGTRPLGFYSVSHNLALRPFMTINPTVTRVAFPVFSRVQSENDRLSKGFLHVIELIAAIMIPVYVALIVLAGPIIRVGPGPQWEASVPLLKILAWAGLVLSLGNPMGSLILSKGRAGMSFAVNVIRLVLDAVVIWITAPMGVAAVAAGILGVRAGVMFPLGFYIRWILLRMGPAVYLKAIAPIAAVCAVMGGVMLGLSAWVPWSGELSRLLVCLLAGAGVYAALMMTWQRARVSRLVALVRS